MKNFVRLVLALLIVFVVIIPAIFGFLFFTKSEYLNDFINFFNEIYLPLSFFLLIIWIYFYIKSKKLKEKQVLITDYLYIFVFFVSSLFFIYLYSSAEKDFMMNKLVTFSSIEFFFPSVGSFLIWLTLAIIIISSYSIYLFFEKINYHKDYIGSLLISILIAFLFGILYLKLPFFIYLEEIFHSLKFSWLRNPGNDIHLGSGLRYCQPPYDASGKKIDAFAPNPPGIRDDIEIIGITNQTIERLAGNWPIDWIHYGKLSLNMSRAENNILLFDISFLDDKGIYGGGNCGILFECKPLNEKVKLKSQVDILAESLKENPNKKLADYPIETTDEARSSIANLNQRLEILNQKERLVNVKNGSRAFIWGVLPIPPVEKVANQLDGFGFANIIKLESGMNRQVPLVARIVNKERASQPDYDPDKDDYFYPNIDLVTAVHYYGVDLKKDVEVDFLKGYVKISNIPERKIRKLDLSTFEEKEYDIMSKPNPERTIFIPIDNVGRMNINFRGGRYCFRAKELLDTLELTPEESAAVFNNKIVLVAMYYATGVGTAKDIHLSPYGDMAGIEHHAYAINTILNQDFLIELKPSHNFLIILIISLIIGLYQPLVKTAYNYILFIALFGLYTIISFFISFDQLNILHIYPTVIILQFAQLAAFIGFRILTEEENVKFIRNTFSKFVSQDIVEELLNNPESITLGGSRKEVTVFFSDVRGFTTISEKLSPEELVQLLNEYLSEMTELIIDYRGTIDKYMGDAIMAFWGAPVKNDDHAYYACVAALAQARKLSELQLRWKERNIPVLNIGIGINTGPAVIGNMGSSRRMDYTLMGDTVNLGSRLEGITKTYGVKICISEFTYEKVKDRVYARELDLVRVKGKLEPVRIYELMGLVNEEDFEKLKLSFKKE